MRKNSKKMAVLTAFFLAGVSLGLSGCKAEETGVSVSSERTETKEEIKEVSFSDQALHARGSAGTMVETEEKLYFRYRNAFYQADKKTQRIRKLYELKKGENNSLFWVYRGKFYFDLAPAPFANPNEKIGLYQLDLEKGTSEKILELSSLPKTLFAGNDRLYIKGYGMEAAYSIKEDGTVGESIPFQDTIYGICPPETTDLSRESLPYVVSRYHYMALQSADGLLLADEDGTNIRTIEDMENTFAAMCAEDGIYAAVRKEDGSYVCRKYDLKTIERTDLFEEPESFTLLQAEDDRIYYMTSGSGEASERNYYFWDLEKNEKKLVYTVKDTPGESGIYTFYGNFYASGDRVYYQKTEDYKLYIEEKELDSEKTERFAPEVFDTKISEVGTVQSEKREVPCACGQKTAAEVYVERLVFQGESDAEKAMNEILLKHFETTMKNGEEMAQTMGEEWVHTDDFSPVSLTESIEEISYLDKNYICLRMEGYEYTGGSHGMPFREIFIFDRQTGKRLGLSDLVNDSEEELKTIVSQKFLEMAEKTEFAFEAPEELAVTVEQRTGYDSDFYMTEDGLVFYYNPYEIAAYAAGFPEALVPYEELDLKIKRTEH